MNIFKYIMGAVIVVAVSGCSQGPSEAEAKKIVQDRMSGCNNLALVKFKKTNGIPFGDGSNIYDVSVAYTIEAKAFGDLKKIYDETQPRLIELKRKQAEAGAAIIAMNSRINSPEFAVEDEATKLKVNEEYQALTKFNSDLYPQIDKLERAGRDESAMKIFACPLVVPVMVLGLDKDATKDFEETIRMRKTDNGWMASQ
ncbi:MAG: hypothetical protein WC216_00335 [Gallionella sp.]|jgi:hypothetical protein